MEKTWSYINARCKHSAVTALTCSVVFLVSFVKSQETESDYRLIFGGDYSGAEQFLAENTWMEDSLQSQGIDPCFALAVVFPELIRYSSIQDFIETRSLEVLYVQYGTVYADFSIGRFQMKPSFAEQVEEDARRWLPASEPLNRIMAVQSDTAGPTTRRDRLFRLCDLEGQLRYLEAFIRLMDHYFPEWNNLPDETQLQYVASAYNSGYQKGEGAIVKKSMENHFYTGIPVNTVKYCYSAISSFFYSDCKRTPSE